MRETKRDVQKLLNRLNGLYVCVGHLLAIPRLAGVCLTPRQSASAACTIGTPDARRAQLFTTEQSQ